MTIVALGLSMDSESKNRGAQDLFEELNACDEIDHSLIAYQMLFMSGNGSHVNLAIGF